MIREGRCTVERAKGALDATLSACDDGIAFINDQLDEVKEDITANRYTQQRVMRERDGTLQQLDENKRALEEAKRNGDKSEAYSRQQCIDRLEEIYGRQIEETHSLERDQAALEREKEQICEHLDAAKYERDRLDREGHDLYNRLVEETEVTNRELQRQADLIMNKR